jgi:serine phosphatase RsbU (regulator of sigma subunit)
MNTTGLPLELRALENQEGEQLGIERLQETCCAAPVLLPGELLGRVFAEVERLVRGRAQHDNMALRSSIAAAEQLSCCVDEAM